MAEQVSHNVVNQLESTSGSPLVDAAANQATFDSAVHGNTITATSSDLIESSKRANEPVSSTTTTSTTATGYGGQTESEALRSAAEPSAGDVVSSSVKDSTALSSSERLSHGLGDLVNGVHDDASFGDGHPDDRSTADVSVDFSVNSDTDTSRADAAEKKEGGHHLRTNSVKKPATFSKVSVTKTFMAKTATAAPTAPKQGEKLNIVSTVLQPTAKPRLVAKSAGSSLRDLQKARLGPDGAGSPDASKVWNKNRPVAPPPPRQFTDEELKQQYGIHLATRLQSDESGKESKWADIDDDEDDWAPDTVVWMDGTKSSLTPQDAAPAEKEPKAAGEQPAQKPVEAAKPTLTSMKRPDQAMTILKPGAAAAVQAKQGGPSAPSPGPDKPSLKVKSSMPPPPVKSPWAPVPKVESISPINPPVQPPQVRPQMAPQDARAYESAAPPPPAREIAADTFDRSWREGEGGARELFNSSNGRYEPAPEGRRNSIRGDVNIRKPAVLQRPAPNAEPSPAFQARPSSQLEGSWGSRRRGSSVSQGSIPPARRLSTTTRGSDLPTAVEDISDEHPSNLPPTTVDPRVDSGRPTFSQQSAWNQQMPPQPAESAEAPSGPMEDDIKRQERVMRETRELAIKRRKEEEAREEAAKQERLKAKLAALAGAGKSKKEREAEAAAAAATASTHSTTSDKATANTEPVVKEEQHRITVEPAQAAETSATLATAGQVPGKQHAADVEQTTANLPSPLPPKPYPASGPERPVSSSDSAQRQAPRSAHMSPRSSTRAPYQPPAAPYKAPNSSSSYSSPGDRKPQPYGRSPIPNENAFSPWPTTAPNSNVWGTAGIGNGTFESASSFAPVPMSQQSSSLPPPPGMARPATSTRISPQGFGQDNRSPGMQQQQQPPPPPPPQANEQQRPFPPPGMEARPDPFGNQSILNGVSSAPGLGRPAHPPGPIGPPSRSQLQQQQQQQSHSQRPDPIAAWNEAAKRLPVQYANDAHAAYERRKQELGGPTPEPPKTGFKETFKQTSADGLRLGGGRRFDKTEVTMYDGKAVRSVDTTSPAPPNVQTQPAGPFSTASQSAESWKQPAENPVRIPDTLPSAAQGGAPAPQPPIGPPTSQYQGSLKFTAAPLPPSLGPKDAVPPPPETDGHPVNSSDYSRPQVRLPPPQAKVKLPPTSPSATSNVPVQSNSVMMPQRPYSGWGPPGAAKPIVMNEAWQARFNGLFNRTPIQTETPPSPPKTPPKMQGPALAVASSSRALVDYQQNQMPSGATVSLPQQRKHLSAEGFVLDDSEASFSKPGIEESFNEELSFGSLPKIKVPRKTNYDTSPYPPTARNLLSMSSNSRFMKSVDSQSRAETDMRLFYRHPGGLFIRILGTRLNNKFCPDKSPAAPNGSGSRKPNVIGDRRASRFSKPKGGKDDSAPSSPAPNAGPRRTTPAHTASSPATVQSHSNEGSTDRRKSAFHRSSRVTSRNQSAMPTTSTSAASATVKSPS